MSVPAVDIDYYETDQTVVAAFLKHQGHQLRGTIWERNVCVFMFEDSQRLRHDMELFESGEAKVEPSAYSRAYGEMRQMIFNLRDQNVNDPGRRPRPTA